MNDQFNHNDIIIDTISKTLEKQNLAKQLFYIWRDYFIKILKNIKPINSIQYFINLKLNAYLSYFKILYYIKNVY